MKLTCMVVQNAGSSTALQKLIFIFDFEHVTFKKVITHELDIKDI